ncbi:AtpC2 [Desulforapulum autotrophicum HRM2]|jgi:F-type H+-transporting ATPase subunit epsilon|uniref:ATP synthase epsilon chain n=1 Tax=Desulforapulum autotrophicum (strain ATCC 43914 / DSM 3382 / VKM B-1955 / HRM2) TaxID=177437 RepID=ATPE_DESAH|nr:F0F1 ATP synthase subunit epsilon [Desulforapulum autotrophicum]C0Q977.1 RecName: Full=ATP synthase epsilon chain; AltName: Full=ATP synthase F1 sector epsilon subunit; AltName: Full=F-ATPase epsilon subunit [Desulforapulum autotrophicum HRM2]ACN16582.1 AtpC2 [Desulforapulum autotrophicum HRM2]
MAENIFLEVVTPGASVVSEEAQIVMAPGSEGEFGVLRGHTTFLTSLKIGSLRYKDAAGKERVLFVNGGFAEVLPTKVTVLAESAERRSQIEVERVRAAKARAEKRISERSVGIDILRAEAALRRAIQRLSVIETR